MESYIVEWLSLLGRWLHFIVGIAWIGSSFYFVWLDNHLVAPKATADSDKGVGGELWSVHGGGFYHAQKYRVAPKTLPETLHWFKWEAYTTWMSGMFLLALIYWYGAEVYLIDDGVAALSQWAAVAIGGAYIVGGWIIYDLVCRSPLGRSDTLLGAILLALLVAAAWSLCQLFSGRGAYIHFGALIGTIMVANVFFVIIPGQRRMVNATASGGKPDPRDGIRAKQRSVHNTYFTLPILFVMISNHYAMTYGHAYNWLILIAISMAGALIRVYFVARHQGKASPLPLAAAALILTGVAAVITPRQSATAAAVDTRGLQIVASDNAAAGFAEITEIVIARCAGCHAEQPSYPGFLAPPAGLLLNSSDAVVRQAEQIYQQSVVTRIMPIGNLTHMREEERALIGAWYLAGAKDHWIAGPSE